MLIANGSVFVLQMIFGPQLTGLLGLNTGTFFSDFPNGFYQVFSYMFLHGGFMHLAFNMFILWMFGTEIEFTWGTRSFGRMYVLSGLAGAVLSLIVHVVFSTTPSVIVGASGAIYGVMMVYWVMFPDRMLYLYFLIPVRVKWAIPGFLLIGLLFGGTYIAHMAHLGGAIMGLLYAKSDWRLLSFSRKVKSFKYRRQEAKLEKNRQAAQDTMRRVDAILDKINEVGIENISKADRKFLEEASSELSRDKDEQGKRQ
ncbi:MAG: rhomboid family intramembrane serine protease [candidate division Zixibacteria bacterium]|nr:rhomboid family intramembrane serine protease [candidate division Zixibacteria bacterium]